MLLKNPSFRPLPIRASLWVGTKHNYFRLFLRFLSVTPKFSIFLKKVDL